MARYTGALCRLCRREGMKLFLKGTRCMTDRCSQGRKSYAPGQHGQSRKKRSDYGLQLREKQKVKTLYGVLERQFKKYFEKAEKSKGVTGEILLQLLERRLDNVIFRLCFAASRAEARQMVRHGLILVNGKRVDIPSYIVRKGEVITVKAKENHQKRIKDTYEIVKDRGIPAWLKLDTKSFIATVDKLPERDDVAFPIEEQLIIELYSK